MNGRLLKNLRADKMPQDLSKTEHDENATNDLKSEKDKNTNTSIELVMEHFSEIIINQLITIFYGITENDK